MRFLDHTWLWDWCREHGFPLDEPDGPVTPRLAADPSLVHRQRPLHSAAANPANARELAARLVAVVGDWDECLAWPTDWDVWPNEENWPRYYSWRDRFGERRSLAAAPGHVFGATDAAELTHFLGHVLECGWDVTLLPSRNRRPTGFRVHTSHDEWIELLSAAPIDSFLAAG
jgi:hypothetical protein